MADLDPIVLFREWYAAAQRCPEIVDASAMALATANVLGRPSVRVVLLKQVDEHGFVFYTNRQSPKGHDLRENPQAELCFHWAPLRQQVRVHGSIESVPPYQADEYFASRPRLSQLGAWASKQSEFMPNRLALPAAVAAQAAKFHVGAVPRPPHWSGYRLRPETMEFWSERPFRLHERFVFLRVAGAWEQHWLYP